MKKTILSVLLAGLFAVPAVSSAGDKPVDLQMGKSMYNEYCFMCHDKGLWGAPQPGVKADWAKRLPLGEDTLFSAVIEGPNHMYSKGVTPLDSEWQVRSMLGYMMSTVVDDENRKTVDTASATEKEQHLWLVRGYKLYDQSCFKCHANGDLGAPRLGKPEDWVSREHKDIDSLSRSVIDGKGHMYTRAGSHTLSEADYKDMIAYMLSTLESK
jgi:cytochrome c5